MELRQQIPIARAKEEYKADHLDTSHGKFSRKYCFLSFNLLKYPVYANGIEDSVRNIPTWYHQMKSPHTLVIFIFEGSIRYLANGEVFPLHQNQALVIPGGMEYRFETRQIPHYKKTTLFLLGVNLPAILETFGLHQPGVLGIRHPELFREKLDSLAELLTRKDPAAMPLNIGLTMELLAELAEYRSVPTKVPLALQIAKSRLSGNFQEPVNIAALAEELQMPLRSFNRMFHEIFRISPRKFRKQCRIDLAKEYLVRSTLSIKEIANELGYCNAFYFSNEFRSSVGCSPSCFREKNAAS